MNRSVLALVMVGLLLIGSIGIILTRTYEAPSITKEEHNVIPASPTRADPNLVAEWHMDEGTGNSVGDTSGNGNQGTLNVGGGDNVNSKWVDGVKGKALKFDGKDDYVDCGNDASMNITGRITLEAWMKKNELSRIESIVSKGPYSLKIGADNKPYFEVITGSETIADVGQLGTNTKVCSLAVYDGKLYGGTHNSGKVYRYDGGTTWTDVGRLGSNFHVWSLTVYNGKLYGGTQETGRVYRYDGGTTWTDVV